MIDPPLLDQVLAGLVMQDHPAAADVDDSWIAAPRWRRVLRALTTHRRDGGQLGDILIAAAVLDSAGVDFPLTTAAEAVVAVLESAPAAYVVDRARERTVRLRVHRLARVVEQIADADLDKMPIYLGRVAAELQCAAAGPIVEARI
jgi:hypothetical protein